MVLVPVIVALVLLENFNDYAYWIAAGLMFAAAFTDWLDGFLARRWHITSTLGAFLDTIADKLLVAGTLFALCEVGRAWAWAGFIIIGREIAISALREWMAKLGRSGNVAVSFIGKLKTTAQMVAILLLLYHDPLLSLNTQWLGRWLLDIAAFLTLWSMFHYLRMAWNALKNEPAA